VDSKEYQIENASGLSRNNRLSAYALVQILNDAWSNPSIRPEFLSSLALGGLDGTLEDRRLKVNQNGALVRAKTGSLNDVSAISGFIFQPDGQNLTFSILVNDLNKDHESIHLIQDQFITELIEAKI
jgi:D-alanyl-D-alanine carboxypeptidase/D-alanyl-D-alanine-endopeptidase (penicillin-binding protein 4)